MRRRISIRGCVRPSVGPSVRPSVRPSVCPVLFSKVKNTHTRRIFCRVSGLVLCVPINSLSHLSSSQTLCSYLPWFLDKFFWPFLVSGKFLHIIFEANCAIGEDVEGFRMALEELDELKDTGPDDRFDCQVCVVLSGKTVLR